MVRQLSSACLVAPFVLALAALPAWADDARIGVTGPVEASATATMAGGKAAPAITGQDVVAHEVFATDATGQAEIMFLDRSSLRIGPNSEMTVDDFSYSPQDVSGKLAATGMKGLLRFSGGDLSKKAGQVSLKTPSAILGVRGGIALVEVDGNTTRATFLYGGALTITGTNGSTVTITRPGFFSTITQGGNPSTPQEANAGDLATRLASLRPRGSSDGDGALNNRVTVGNFTNDTGFGPGPGGINDLGRAVTNSNIGGQANTVTQPPAPPGSVTFIKHHI